MNQPGQLILPVLLAVVSFFAVTSGLRALMPEAEDSVVAAKLEYLRDHADEYDAVLVGSSGIFRHFIPRVIDRILEEHGHPQRSFNLGGPGMFAFETDHILRRVLALPGLELQRVYLEPLPWDPYIAQEIIQSERAIDWHTLRQTVYALDSIRRKDLTRSERWDLALTHLRMFCWRRSNYGQGGRIASRFLDLPRVPAPITEEDLARQHGYQSIEEAMRGADRDRAGWYRNRSRTLRENLDDYRAAVQALRRPVAEVPDLGTVNARATRAQQEAIRQAGATPIYVMAPVSQHEPTAVALDQAGLLPHYLPFNNAARYPEFYPPDQRFDEDHLINVAAREFSVRFAEVLAEHLNKAESR